MPNTLRILVEDENGILIYKVSVSSSDNRKLRTIVGYLKELNFDLVKIGKSIKEIKYNIFGEEINE